MGKNNSGRLVHVPLVDAARGAAAFYVFLHHAIIIGHLEDLVPGGKFLFYPFSFASEAVYLFFFLSGFSIHYSSHNRPLETPGGIGHYYYLRFRRIYPIFLVAVALALALNRLTAGWGIVSSVAYHPGGRDLAYVLLFGTDIRQGAWHAGLANNPALWSLSYEIPYYLAYPAFWWCYKKLGGPKAFLISLLLSGVFILADCCHANHLSNVFSLYWLWTAGALMAEWKLAGRQFELSTTVYFLVLFVSICLAESLEALAVPVVSENLKALPIGLAIFSTYAVFPPLAPAGRRWAAGMIAALLLTALWATRGVPTWGRHIFLDARLVIAAVFLVWLLLSGRDLALLCKFIARPFLAMGAISYALYVVHTPILYFAADFLGHLGQSGFLIALAFVPIFLLAWGLETKFQSLAVGCLESIRTKVVKNK